MGRGSSTGHDDAVARRSQAPSIPYADIENAGDRQLEDAIRSWLRCEPAELTFAKARVPVERLRGNFTEDAELFLGDGDEEGYETVLSLAEAFERGDEIPPIVIAPDGEGHAVLDGCHRLSGAWRAGMPEIDVYIADRPVAF